jgi:hypothetical protein
MKIIPTSIQLLDQANNTYVTWQDKINIDHMMLRLIQSNIPVIENVSGEIKEIALKCEIFGRIAEAQELGIDKHYATHAHMIKFSNDEYVGGYYFFIQKKGERKRKNNAFKEWLKRTFRKYLYEDK